ncbi:hypothetical protein DV532_05705 [Pseudomonas sp. Leaf58]|nr:hypothetical protein DV532_05705 [Pseudomonas sp. Leaf58]
MCAWPWWHRWPNASRRRSGFAHSCRIADRPIRGHARSRQYSASRESSAVPVGAGKPAKGCRAGPGCYLTAPRFASLISSSPSTCRTTSSPT